MDKSDGHLARVACIGENSLCDRKSKKKILFLIRSLLVKTSEKLAGEGRDMCSVTISREKEG